MKIYLVSINKVDYDLDECDHVGAFGSPGAARACLIAKGANGPWGDNGPDGGAPRAWWSALPASGGISMTGYIEELEVQE